MKVRISELRAAINKFLTEALAEIEQEDVDRLRRAKDGYGETEFEEDVDRLRRAADGYGETEFEEGAFPDLDTDQGREDAAGMAGGMAGAALGSAFGPLGSWAGKHLGTALGKDAARDATAKQKGMVPQEASLATAPPQAQSQKGPKRDKSQMQGVGPRPTLATAFGEQEPKKEASLATAPPTAQSMKGPKKDKSQMQGVGPRQTLSQVFGNDEQPQTKKEASLATAPPQAQSQKPPKKDKSQMQGVGPRPTMANAFDDIGSKKKSEAAKMDDKTNVVPGVAQQQAARKAELDAAKKKDIDSHVNDLEKDAKSMASKEPKKFKFTKQPNGDFALSRLDLEGSTPSDEEELFIVKNKADFKKRYGKAYKDRLYAKAKEKFRK